MIKRQHPIMVIYKIYSQIRYSIIPIAALLYNEIRGGTGQQPGWVYNLAIIYGIMAGSWSILAWYRETYQLDSSVLHITRGVFTVSQRTIPLIKITNIKIEQSWIYRLLGIANVELQTSDSNASADARLVTSSKMAESLKKSLGHSERRNVNTSSKEHHVTQKEILMLSMSSNTFWLGLPITVAVIQQFWSWLSPEPEEEQASFVELFKRETWSGITLSDSIKVSLILGAFLVSCALITWLFSLGTAQLRYKSWQLSRSGDVLSIHYGSLERKSVQFQVKRIQSLRIKDLMFGRLYGYASVYIDCVGYSGERKVKLLIPSIRTSELTEVLGRMLPEFQLQAPERAIHRNAKFAAATPVLLMLVIGIIAGSYFTLWFLLMISFLYIVYRYITYSYANTKWECTANLFVLRKAGFNQTTVYLLRESVESISIRQSSWQKLFHIYQLKMEIDSPANFREYLMSGVTYPDYEEILRWYKNKS